MKVKTAKRIRRTGLALFVLYVILLVYLLFFAEEYGRQDGGQLRYNLVPLKEIRRFLMNADVLGWKAVFLNICGNILAFVPFGAILPVLIRKMRRCWKMTALTAAFSAAVELVQLLTRVGACDVDDVILNTLGGFTGYLLFAACNAVRRRVIG